MTEKGILQGKSKNKVKDAGRHFLFITEEV